MTLVVTTVSRNGITLVGDRAVSEKRDETVRVIDKEARKVFHSAAANIGFAAWGSVTFPGNSYGQWLSDFVDALPAATSLSDAADLLASELNAQLGPIAERKHGWADLRRGIHVSGYVADLPCVYHVHTGDPNIANHELRVHYDFPVIHGGGEDEYARRLRAGVRFQLFNGFHELFGKVGESLAPLRTRLEEEYGVPIPAPSLRGQIEFDRTCLRLVAGLLRAAERVPAVSVELFDLAFDRSGIVEMPRIATDVDRFPPQQLTDFSASVTIGPTSSLWEHGVHGDGPPDLSRDS
jgi:hypothetical protein